MSGQSEGEVREGVTLVAFDGVLSVVALLGTHFLVQKLGEGGRESNERGTGVEDDTSVVELGGVLAEGDGVEIDFPVRLAAERDLGHRTGVVILVNTAEGGDGLITVLVGVAKVEAKDRLIEEVLLQHAVEGRGDLVDGDGVVAETKDTIEATEGKGQAGLTSSLSEELVLDLEVANGDGVLGDETAQATRAIADGELGTVLRIGARRGRVVLAVKVAGDGAAGLRRNPEVGAAGVENDLELLRWRADGDGREV